MYNSSMKSRDMIHDIMYRNKLCKRLSKTDVAKIVAGYSGRSVPQCYITRWLRDEIGSRNFNVLVKVWEELCDQ